jgi:hypothetical protein
MSVAALAACHHDETPTRTPAQETTTTSSYQAYQPATQPSAQAQHAQTQSTYTQPAPQETQSSSYDQDRAAQNADINPAPATPTDPSLMNDQAGASPKTEPGPVNAKQPDKKSPNAAAVTDQGNSKAEVQISGRVRKAMMASKTLSFGAKNVKVITQGTKVTLRGTVKSDAEKNEIAGIARNTNGVSEVDDQLVVKP